MKSFDIDLINPFDDPEITDTRIDPFAHSIITKLGAANDVHQYDEVKAALIAAVNPFHIKMLALVTDKGTNVGETELRVEVISDFLEFLRDNIGSVRKKYKTRNAILLTFYLHGMKDFNAINKSTALGLMTNYALAASTNSADWTTTDPTFVADAAAFPTRYTNAVDNQDDGKTTTGIDRSGRDTGRPLVNTALFNAYNYVKYYTECDPAAVKAIFGEMQALIPSNTHDEVETNKGTVDKKATVNAASDEYDESYYVLFRNKGTTIMKIGAQSNATEAVGTLGKTLKGGKSKTYQIITLGIPGAQFLNITNTDINDMGEWEVEIFTIE